MWEEIQIRPSVALALEPTDLTSGLSPRHGSVNLGPGAPIGPFRPKHG